MPRSSPKPTFRYEAKIQIRPKKDDILLYILKSVEKRKDCTLSYIDENKYGYDIYLSNQKYARSLGKKLKDNFKGKLIITKTIVGRNKQKSKNTYRATICFRCE